MRAQTHTGLGAMEGAGGRGILDRKRREASGMQAGDGGGDLNNGNKHPPGQPCVSVTRIAHTEVQRSLLCSRT